MRRPRRGLLISRLKVRFLHCTTLSGGGDAPRFVFLGKELKPIPASVGRTPPTDNQIARFPCASQRGQAPRPSDRQSSRLFSRIPGSRSLPSCRTPSERFCSTSGTSTAAARLRSSSVTAAASARGARDDRDPNQLSPAPAANLIKNSQRFSYSIYQLQTSSHPTPRDVAADRAWYGPPQRPHGGDRRSRSPPSRSESSGDGDEPGHAAGHRRATPTNTLGTVRMPSRPRPADGGPVRAAGAGLTAHGEYPAAVAGHRRLAAETTGSGGDSAASPRAARSRRTAGAPSPPPGSAAGRRRSDRSGPRSRTRGAGAGPTATVLARARRRPRARRQVRAGRSPISSGRAGPAGRGTPATAGVAGAQGRRAAPTAPAGPPGAPSSRRARKDQRHLRRSTRPGPAPLTPAPPPGRPAERGPHDRRQCPSDLGPAQGPNRPSDRELSEATRTSG